MSRLTQQQEHERDARDLRILELLDSGMSQRRVAAVVGAARGPIVRMLADIRHDEDQQ